MAAACREGRWQEGAGEAASERPPNPQAPEAYTPATSSSGPSANSSSRPGPPPGHKGAGQCLAVLYLLPPSVLGLTHPQAVAVSVPVPAPAAAASTPSGHWSPTPGMPSAGQGLGVSTLPPRQVSPIGPTSELQRRSWGSDGPASDLQPEPGQEWASWDCPAHSPPSTAQRLGPMLEPGT